MKREPLSVSEIKGRHIIHLASDSAGSSWDRLRLVLEIDEDGAWSTRFEVFHRGANTTYESLASAVRAFNALPEGKD